jgi:Leucine-rich repeat (LRR) protein
MTRAFELIAEIGRVQDEEPETDIRSMLKEVQVVGGLIVNMDMQGDFRQYVINALQRARDQVARIQFSWYQFEELPRGVVGSTYPNLRHVDIRQNGEIGIPPEVRCTFVCECILLSFYNDEASLKCIDSIITQLPHLSSLNISDCPNLLTLAPLAKCNAAIASFDHNDGEQPSNLNLKHLWVRGCNLSEMSRAEWSAVFDALSKSSGPLERMTLSRNRISYLEGGISKLKNLSYLFVEDNYFVEESTGVGKAFNLPDELGCKLLKCHRVTHIQYAC